MFSSQRLRQCSEDSIRAFVGTAGVFGIGPQQHVGTVAETLRHRVHGDAAVEEGGCVRHPQIVKPQPGEAELAEACPDFLGQRSCIADACEVEPSIARGGGGEDQRLGRQPERLGLPPFAPRPRRAAVGVAYAAP